MINLYSAIPRIVIIACCISADDFCFRSLFLMKRLLSFRVSVIIKQKNVFIKTAKLSIPAPIIFPIKINDEYLQHLLVRDLLNVFENGFYQFSKRSLFRHANQGKLIQGKAQLALKNWKNLFGDQREDSWTSLEVCKLLKTK